MSGTKVLPVSNLHQKSPPVPPLDLSPYQCMPESPTLPRWPSLSSPKLMPRTFSHLLSPPSSPGSPLSRSPLLGRKKRVVFADSKGLALYTVQYYTQDEYEEEQEEEEKVPASPALAGSPTRLSPALAESPTRLSPALAGSPTRLSPALAGSPTRLSPALAGSPTRLSPALAGSPTRLSPALAGSPPRLSPALAESPPGLARLPGPGAAGEKSPEFRGVVMRGRPQKLRLGFTQPGADSVAFRVRLLEELVLLESCQVTADSLSGTVRARSLSFDRGAPLHVQVRVTFDSWRTHRDIPCIPQPQSPGPIDTDLFTFDIPLPGNLDPRDRMEFCISFRHGRGALMWDKNKGQNYRILVSADSDTPAANLLASHRSSVILHAKRKGLWDGSHLGAGPRKDLSPTSLMFRSTRRPGTDWAPLTPPGSPVK
ncbi:hypothetical protein GJAV_G00049370 [Gymnothorax javanicus]|nr:hypothetical protein GJAV_G00049370 [Gymnothorax javanicus]